MIFFIFKHLLFRAHDFCQVNHSDVQIFQISSLKFQAYVFYV